MSSWKVQVPQSEYESVHCNVLIELLWNYIFIVECLQELDKTWNFQVQERLMLKV